MIETPLSLKQAAAYLNMSPRQLEYRADSGRIRFTLDGCHRRFFKADLDRYIKELRANRKRLPVAHLTALRRVS